MRKVLLGLSLVLLLFAVVGATAAAQASTLLSDDYEGAVKWNPSSSGWAISTTRAYGGTHSAHAPSSMTPLMVYGPFDLSAATAATLSFQLWYYAPKVSYPPGSQATAGAFLVGYSTNGSSFTFPYQWSGSTSGEWWPTEFDLGSWSLLGQPQVRIALGTTVYPGALYSEGAYVDDLSLTATIPDTTPPTTKAPFAATARRGYSATLKYKVVEVGANGGTATVTIKVKNPAGTVVKTLGPYTGKAVNKLLAAKFTVPRTWRTGTYHFYIYATDQAGNTQAKPVGVNHLYVK